MMMLGLREWRRGSDEPAYREASEGQGSSSSEEEISSDSRSLRRTNSLQSDPTRCQACGHLLDEDSLYCGNCGKPRPIETSSPEALRRRLASIRIEQTEARERVAEAKRQRDKLERCLKDQMWEENRILHVLEAANPPVSDGGPPPPGPRCLQFVEEPTFTTIASLVIIINVLILFYETSHPGSEDHFSWTNRAIIGFYTVELFLKMLLWRNLFLCGPLTSVLWNVLDLVIVVGGLLDTFVIPLFNAGKSKMKFLSLLRVLRLARLVKLVRNFFMSDTTWAANEPFQIFIMCIIALSSLIMGLECDFPQLTVFLESIYWEHIILAIFAFEVAVNLKQEGLRFFYDYRDWIWNWLDFVIVAGGVIDQWMLPGEAIIVAMVTGDYQPRKTSIGSFMATLRMARLLRVLRLVRLVRRVPQLFNLLTGIAQAMAGMSWVLLLTIVVLYFFALLAVKLFRDGMVFGGDPPEDVQELFRSVCDSIFVLFTVMDGHKSILDPLLDALPATKVVFMAFVMVSEWAMLSILTAVVSERMITVTEGSKEEEQQQERITQQMAKVAEIETLFKQMDANSDGVIDLAEFDKMLEDEEKKAQLCQALKWGISDLRLMFNILERNGSVSLKEFLGACGAETKPLSERSLMKLEKRLAGVEEKVSTTVVTVDGAGKEHCNGLYVEHGTHHMKPLYTKVDDICCIIYFDFYWKLSDQHDTSQFSYCMKAGQGDEGTSERNRASWTSFDEECGRPPTVVWESRHLLDKRIEYLEGLVLQSHRDLKGLMRCFFSAGSLPPMPHHEVPALWPSEAN